MKELMQHVERIVRPVRANEGRKLGMRRELLGHLQAALEEELEKNPSEESTALERAKRRLGEPLELMRQLQESVPAWERVLRSGVPGFGALDVMSRPSGAGQWRNGAIASLNRLPMGLGLAITIAATTLPVFAFVFVASRVVFYPLFMQDWGGYAQLVQTGALVVLMSQCWIAVAWMAELLRRNRQRRGRAWGLGMVLFLIQLWWAPLSWTVRPLDVKLQFLASAMGSAVGLLAMLTLIALVVEVRLRAYEPWLELDIAQ